MTAILKALQSVVGEERFSNIACAFRRTLRLYREEAAFMAEHDFGA